MKYKMQTRHVSGAMMALLLLGSCTYYVPAKVATSRVGDTLSVALAGPGAARWEPRKDSLVIECAGCSEEAAREVEHFADHDEAQFDVANSEQLTLLLYSMGHVDTVTIPGTTSETETTPKPRLLRHRYRPAAEPATEGEVKAAEAKAAAKAKAAAAEKALAKTTLLKVTAPEGVAIYKDKTKREVLKILPQGSTIVLLAKEGDLYSVSIDGQEGFVDAEAVQVQE